MPLASHDLPRASVCEDGADPESCPRARGTRRRLTLWLCPEVGRLSGTWQHVSEASWAARLCRGGLALPRGPDRPWTKSMCPC